LIRAAYCVRDPLEHLSQCEKHDLRRARRTELVYATTTLLFFFQESSFEKKDPGLVIKAVELLPPGLRQRTSIHFMGSGELEADLKRSAAELGGVCAVPWLRESI
jgi:hypothetical protein